ncbi:DUF6744 family protein [Catenulispora yoronensis]
MLGFVVFYTVCDAPVTRDDLVNWFRELGLSEDYLPNELRPIDAAERATGSTVRLAYLLDGAEPERLPNGRRKRKSRAALDREATLMVRPVSRTKTQVVRHVVREVRDEAQVALSYDPRMADAVFTKDNSENSGFGAGSFGIVPNHPAINALPPVEQEKVRQFLDDIQEAYRTNLAFVPGDRLRDVVRAFIEDVMAGTRLRASGGVYFVAREHHAVLEALRELIGRFNERAVLRTPEEKKLSSLRRIPLPDQGEMRDMVEEEFTNRAREELDRLAVELAVLRRAPEPDPELVAALHKRYLGLKATTDKHSTLLSTSLEDTQASLETVKDQFARLMAGSDDD